MFFQFVFILDQIRVEINYNLNKEWSKKIFCFLLYITRTNGQTIFSKNKRMDPRSQSSSQFLWKSCNLWHTSSEEEPPTATFPHLLYSRLQQSTSRRSWLQKEICVWRMELWFQTRWLVGEVAVEVVSVIDRIPSLTHQIVQEAENVGNASILFKEMDTTGRSKDWAVRHNNVNSVRMKIERNDLKEIDRKKCLHCQSSDCNLQELFSFHMFHVPCSDQFVINENNNEFDYEIE